MFTQANDGRPAACRSFEYSNEVKNSTLIQNQYKRKTFSLVMAMSRALG
jgi:hypothetical protein